MPLYGSSHVDKLKLSQALYTGGNIATTIGNGTNDATSLLHKEMKVRRSEKVDIFEGRDIYKNYIFIFTLIFLYCKRWVSLCLASMLSINHAKTKSNNCQQQRAWGGRIVMHPCYVFSFFMRQTPPNCNYSTLYGEVRFTLSLAILGYLSPCKWPSTFSLAPIWTALRGSSCLQVIALGMRF
ncbi:hypothetical protein BDL97_03G129500 [Sphagnum fallax]|nr:hypothetical protein BDL97_03G129500 [Sphagnum fallax]KAH8968477.1 hypothetical protein BDL97_03G129500 [Sphagnum fallax]